jgi:hypothetical protein
VVCPAVAQDTGLLLSASPVVVQASNPSTPNFDPIDFGAAVALDGDLLVVGAPKERLSTDSMVANVGAVYIFERQGFAWVEQQKLRAPVEFQFEEFGRSVGVARGSDLNGPIDYLVVGAPGFDTSTGRAYLFSRVPGGSFVFETVLTQEVPSAGVRFGQSAAIDFFVAPNSVTGDAAFFVAVGAPFNRDPNDAGNSQRGSLSIFQRTGGPPTWALSHEFYADPNQHLGLAVAMSRDDIVAAGDITDPQGMFGGALHISQENEQPGGVFHYVQDWKLVPQATSAVGIGGSVAAQSGGIAVLGAPLDDSVDVNAGKVYIFDITPGGMGTTRTEVATLAPTSLGFRAEFGTAVALSGSILAVSAPGQADDGQIYLFEQGATSADWTEVGAIMPSSTTPPTFCKEGASLALQGLTAVVGCPSRDLVDDGGALIYFASGIFFDGFETGNTTAWSASQP